MNNDLVIGRGELHLNIFAPGTKTGLGERYVGNTPGFTISVREEAVERKSSFKGLLHLSERYVVGRDYSGVMICDQMSRQNLALWMGSESSEIATAATGVGPVISESMPVYKGYGYQLGAASNPLGARNLTNVVFKIAGVPISQPDNVFLDAAAGRFTVLPNAVAIAEGVMLTIEYKTTGYTRQQIGSQRELKGSLRYVSRNHRGRMTDMFFPYVVITPDGAFDLKTTEWQRMQFAIAVLKLPGREIFYAGSLKLPSDT